MASQKSVLLAGATGLVGGELLKILQKDSERAIHLVLRRPLNLDLERVAEHVVDFNQVHDLDLEVNQVFCALGTTMKKAGSKEQFKQVDYHYVMNLGRLALKCGADFFLISSLGADDNSGSFYLKVKGEVERDLAALGLKSLNIFRPSLMHAGRKERRLGEAALHVVFKLPSPLFQGPLRKYRAVSGAQVAQAVMAAAENPQSGTHFFESNGFQHFPPSI